MIAVDSSTDKTPPSSLRSKRLWGSWKGGKAAEICKNSTEMLKAGGQVIIHVVHAVWQFSAIPFDWKSGLVVPIWKGNLQTATITCVLHCSVYQCSVPLSVCSSVADKNSIYFAKVPETWSIHIYTNKINNQSDPSPSHLYGTLMSFSKGYSQSMFILETLDSVHHKALWDILWDSCRDYWPDDRPLLWHWKCCKVGGGDISSCIIAPTLAWTEYLAKLLNKGTAKHLLATSKSLTMLLQMMLDFLQNHWRFQ